MDNLLKINKKIKFIPGNVKNITDGVITDLKDNYYVVLLNKEFILKQNETVEVIIPELSSMIKAECSVIQQQGKTIHLSIPESTQTMQRREYPRVDIKLPVTLNELDKSNKEVDSTTQNLSGGGMQLITGDSFIVGSLLKAKFVILDKKSIETVLEVLRIDRKEKEYCLSGKFKDLSNVQRTAIIQVCFKRQLELKYKGIKSNLYGIGGENH